MRSEVMQALYWIVLKKELSQKAAFGQALIYGNTLWVVNETAKTVEVCVNVHHVLWLTVCLHVKFRLRLCNTVLSTIYHYYSFCLFVILWYWRGDVFVYSLCLNIHHLCQYKTRTAEGVERVWEKRALSIQQKGRNISDLRPPTSNTNTTNMSIRS